MEHIKIISNAIGMICLLAIHLAYPMQLLLQKVEQAQDAEHGPVRARTRLPDDLGGLRSLKKNNLLSHLLPSRLGHNMDNYCDHNL